MQKHYRAKTASKQRYECAVKAWLKIRKNAVKERLKRR